MHLSADDMKTLAFVLLLLLVAIYMHLAQAPRREPRSLIDFTRHNDDAPAPEDARETPEPAPSRSRAR